MNLDYEDQLELSQLLEKLATGQGGSTGICSIVQFRLNYRIYGWLRKALRSGICEEWGHYSGFHEFPVPDPDVEVQTEKSAASAYLRCVDYWDPDSEYGRLRRSLALYLSREVLTWENPVEAWE
jgi:hypothetical protein